LLAYYLSVKSSTHFLLFWFALGATLATCPFATAQVTGLSFRPVDAAYSLALDRIILISANPNQLHIYDPVAQLDLTVALAEAPQNVCLSPDGMHAAVAFSTDVDYVDLQGATVTNTFSNVAVGTGKLICGIGYIYVFPSYVGNVISIDITTGSTTVSNTFPYASGGIFDSALNAIYSTEDGISPNSLNRFDTSGGTVGASTSQPFSYFAVFNVCGPLWLSHDGATIYSSCGAVYRASSDPTKDMRYLGVLPGVNNSLSLATSDLLNQIAVIPAVKPFAQPPVPLADTVVNLYSSSSFNPVGQFATTPFQVNSNSYPAHGHWVFYNSSSSAMFIITQADSSAGLQQDYAIENVTLTNPNSCNATFAATSASAIASGSYATTQILSGTDCAFTAVSDAPWIVLSAGYYGSENTTLTYLARPNLSNASRSGTIHIGSDTFTVNQDAAGPASSLNPLSFRPVAAAYDKTFDKIVMVSASPNELHIYDPGTHADQIVPLSYLPLSLSVRPDGLFAAVGHSGHVSIVDLQANTISQTIPVDMDAGGIALAGNGYAYAFPSQTNSWANINSVQLSTDGLTELYDVYYGNIPRLNASGDYLYVSALGTGSSRLDISSGPATLTNQFYGSFFSSLSGNIWLSEDGNRLINSSGGVFFTSPVPSQDLQPDGNLSNANTVDWAADSYIQQQIAVLTDVAGSNAQLQIYASNGLQLVSQTTLPGFSNGGTAYVSHGRYLFWNAAASKLFAITEADSTSGLISDYAVYTATPPNSPPACTYSVSPNSLEAPAFYASSWVFKVTSNCVWLPIIPFSNWLTPGSPGATTGNGYLTINVQSNPGGVRTGSIMIGDQTVTITQNSSTCGYTLASINAFFPRSGGIRTVNLAADANCSWSVQSDSSWLTVISSPSGTGPATIQYSVASAPNLVGSRFGILNIAGFAYKVIQTRTSPTQISSFDVWRPSNGTWFLLDKANTSSYPKPTAQQQWGLPGDIPVPGDYDGDGKTDYAVWRPSNGIWFIIPSSNPGTSVVQQWGLPGDIPVPGDYDGDGRTDFAVWRPSNGTWFVLYNGAAYTYPIPSLQQQWGLPGDVPVPGDYNGDGEIDFAVWRPSNGTWFVLYNGATNTYPNPSLQQQWGLPGDKPLVGDFNGDGSADFTVWRPSNGTWFVLYNGTTNTYPNPSLQQQWGLPGDLPLIGDFNDDGNTDFTVWRPSIGTWFVLYNGVTNTYPFPGLQQQWGLPGDVPVAAK